MATSLPPPIPLPEGERAIGAVAISPDGKHLALGDQRITLCELATGRVLRQLGPFEGRVASGSLAFSPDGRELAFALSNVPARVVDLATMRLRSLGPKSAGARSLSFAANGDVLVAGRAGAHLFARADPRPLWSMANRERRDWRGAISPDGERAVIGNTDEGRATIFHLESGEPAVSLEMPTPAVEQLRWDPAGRRIAGVRVAAWLWDLRGATVRRRRLETTQALSIAFSADGRRIAVGTRHGQLSLFRGSGEKLGSATVLRRWVWDVAFTSTRAIACAGENSELVWTSELDFPVAEETPMPAKKRAKPPARAAKAKTPARKNLEPMKCLYCRFKIEPSSETDGVDELVRLARAHLENMHPEHRGEYSVEDLRERVLKAQGAVDSKRRAGANGSKR